MRVGILTYHRAYNYGAYLQACALCNRINQVPNIVAEIIDFQMKKEKDFYNIEKYPFNKKIKYVLKGTYSFYKSRNEFYEKAINDSAIHKSSTYLCSDEVTDFQRFVKGKYDVIVAGSDEIWKVIGFRGFPNPYWLIGDLGCRKFSYAVSARVNYSNKLTCEQLKIAKKAISDFDFISVRDNKTFDALQALQATDKPIHQCCDPSFLYDFNIGSINAFQKIKIHPRYDAKKKTILVCLNDDKSADRIRHELKKNYNLVAAYIPHKGYLNLPNITPVEWLSIIRDVDFIITALFHGACFSIVQHTPFLAIDLRSKGDSKLSDLLENSPLHKRYVSDWNKIGSFQSLIEQLSDCEGFDSFIIEKRSTSKAFFDKLIQLAYMRDSL